MPGGMPSRHPLASGQQARLERLRSFTPTAPLEQVTDAELPLDQGGVDQRTGELGVGRAGGPATGPAAHCWVRSPTSGPPYEGLVLDWDRRPDGTWRAWVIYLVDEPAEGPADEDNVPRDVSDVSGVRDVGDVGEPGSRRLPVQGWVDRADLRPAR